MLNIDKKYNTGQFHNVLRAIQKLVWNFIVLEKK